MNTRVQQWVLRRFTRVERVPIAQCVHYGAFRYGRDEVHPYENFAIALARGESVEVARERFVDFLQHYRPKDFGAALGVRLGRDHPLWQFPWARMPRQAETAAQGWSEDPNDSPDIVTHFSAAGILRFRIAQEFFWLENAYYSIARWGYQPRRFGQHITACRLLRRDGTSMYLILDGNHRLSAISALGHREVELRHAPWRTVRETRVSRWPRVADGTFTPADASLVLTAYFLGNSAARTTETPAPLLDVNALPWRPSTTSSVIAPGVATGRP